MLNGKINEILLPWSVSTQKLLLLQFEKVKSLMDNEIILYQPDNTISLEVRVEDETVWLNRNQIATLFDRDVKTIGKHINNALKDELASLPTVAKFATVQKEGNRMVTREIEYYNLDVILSVGYRVKSQQGIKFRQWANRVLKEFLLKGYTINHRLLELENRIDSRLYNQQRQIDELSDKVDLIITSNLKPTEGIFFDGQIWDAYTLINDLIRSGKHRVVVIDNYADDSVLTQLDKRNEGVGAAVYTLTRNRQIQQDIERHNQQYAPIKLHFYNKAHDRFLIVDNVVYHIGASFKDLGKKLFAFSRMESTTGDEMLARLNSTLT